MPIKQLSLLLTNKYEYIQDKKINSQSLKL